METRPKPRTKINKGTDTTKIIVSVIIILLVFGVVFLLSYEKETTTNNKIEPKVYKSLSCERNFQDENYMLIARNAKSIKETLKASFSSDKLIDVYYKFIGNYDNEDIAASDAINMLARYDNYIGVHGGSRSLYNPNHSNTGNTASFSMYAKASSITESTKAMFFFSETDEPKTIGMESLKQIYEKRSFICSDDN